MRYARPAHAHARAYTHTPCRYSINGNLAITSPSWYQPTFSAATWPTGKAPLGYSTDVLAFYPAGWGTTLPGASVTSRYFFK
jgi:hypothetical protein